jgi:hypothetical protein
MLAGSPRSQEISWVESGQNGTISDVPVISMVWLVMIWVTSGE